MTAFHVAMMMVAFAAIWYITLPSKGRSKAEGFSSLEVDLPEELAGSNVYLRESSIRCRAPIQMHGDPDEVFIRKRDRVLVVSDIKSRKKVVVHDSDVMQLSCYAYILRHRFDHIPGIPLIKRFIERMMKTKVAKHGYIRIVTGTTTRYVQVQLYSDEVVEQAYRAAQLLKEGKTTGSKAANRRLCDNCGFKSDC